jgi:hypothetical protein
VSAAAAHRVVERSGGSAYRNVMQGLSGAGRVGSRDRRMIPRPAGTRPEFEPS